MNPCFCDTTRLVRCKWSNKMYKSSRLICLLLSMILRLSVVLQCQKLICVRKVRVGNTPSLADARGCIYCGVLPPQLSSCCNWLVSHENIVSLWISKWHRLGPISIFFLKKKAYQRAMYLNLTKFYHFKYILTIKRWKRNLEGCFFYKKP